MDEARSCEGAVSGASQRMPSILPPLHPFPLLTPLYSFPYSPASAGPVFAMSVRRHGTIAERERSTASFSQIEVHYSPPALPTWPSLLRGLQRTATSQRGTGRKRTRPTLYIS